MVPVFVKVPGELAVRQSILPELELSPEVHDVPHPPAFATVGMMGTVEVNKTSESAANFGLGPDVFILLFLLDSC